MEGGTTVVLPLHEISLMNKAVRDWNAPTPLSLIPLHYGLGSTPRAEQLRRDSSGRRNASSPILCSTSKEETLSLFLCAVHPGGYSAPFIRTKGCCFVSRGRLLWSWPGRAFPLLSGWHREFGWHAKSSTRIPRARRSSAAYYHEPGWPCTVGPDEQRDRLLLAGFLEMMV